MTCSHGLPGQNQNQLSKCTLHAGYTDENVLHPWRRSLFPQRSLVLEALQPRIVHGNFGHEDSRKAGAKMKQERAVSRDTS